MEELGMEAGRGIRQRSDRVVCKEGWKGWGVGGGGHETVAVQGGVVRFAVGQMGSWMV